MKKIDSLNLIPFIDIMLVLLVIVLTSASFVQQSRIEVEIPKLEEGVQSSEDTQVQEEMIRRSNLHSGQSEHKRVYSSKYALSCIVYCSKCGEIYRRVAWNNRGKRSIVWRCVTRVENGPSTCDAETVQETELQA